MEYVSGARVLSVSGTSFDSELSVVEIPNGAVLPDGLAAPNCAAVQMVLRISVLRRAAAMTSSRATDRRGRGLGINRRITTCTRSYDQFQSAFGAIHFEFTHETERNIVPEPASWLFVAMGCRRLSLAGPPSGTLLIGGNFQLH